MEVPVRSAEGGPAGLAKSGLRSRLGTSGGRGAVRATLVGVALLSSLAAGLGAQTLDGHRAELIEFVEAGRRMDLLRNSERADHRERCRETSERLRQSAQVIETDLRISADPDRLLPVFADLYACISCELGALERCAAAERRLKGWEPF
jgi:hypothetical protein